MSGSGLGPLRRWKRFFSAFGHIDAAIEATHPSISRDEFRSVRGRIVELLCDAAEDDDERAEQLCVALDGAMAESLVTLLEVPVPSRALASGDLAKSVSALGTHESARIRSLTRDVVRGWRSAVQSQLDSANAAMEALNNLSPPLMPPEKERPAFVGNANVPVATSKDTPPAKFPSKSKTPVTTGKGETQSKDTPPAKFTSKSRTPVTSGKDEMQSKDTPAKFPSKRRAPVAGSSCSESDKMLASKRKLREGYQEADNAKSQRKIRVTEDTKMSEQPKEKKMDPITPQDSSRARCGSGTTVRRSLMPSFMA